MTTIQGNITTQGLYNTNNVKFGSKENDMNIPEIGLQEDTLDISKSDKGEAPEIGAMRLMFGFLTDEQVQQINATGKLPPNAKFVPNELGGYQLTNNFFGIQAGTQELPAGFEVKKNVLGFTTIVPKGTKGMLIKDN